jgi:hypothetical protein
MEDSHFILEKIDNRVNVSIDGELEDLVCLMVIGMKKDEYFKEIILNSAVKYLFETQRENLKKIIEMEDKAILN